ncbi:TetR/AcrR family transcriptional regulator [Actinomadura nitritigenes]|uniref:TetR/AcrR family transcriptional regulator n=1 Tax=Actinomadura nitritigenes TaxID=134602 RepID=UPI003D8C878F
MADGPVSRPRVTAGRELELLQAAVEVLREVGYEALTMDAVAARGRCSKATLYRLWGGKPQLVAAGLRVVKRLELDTIDTGNLRDDLVTVCERLLANAEKEALLFAALTHAALVDPDLAAAMREALFRPDAEQLHAILDRAVARGELAAPPSGIDFLPGLVGGGLVLRPLFQEGRADRALVGRFVDEVLLPVLRR